ncbi:hypothetical protein KIJ96_15535 [Pseudoalteromonas piscicida]|uniref:hypothetical protein n=1 Tax=Pseudoalteromonas TaxID=53246 RepID=UPI001D0A46A4|nr:MULTISPECIES: hypothetical protein [Pseudoalteromonas]MCF7512665.1 hypothetical protein [Pseudoalteromonas sp. L7]MCF7524121.1 hypothetical protein [Pseudoalteromonas sp. L23]MCX2767308.1 hypothetical protein [Pseudoalteromonas sp. B530]UDM61199.1 hypothetical protein KIJ96_15535 [Pseudoalteromonas piscicida]
MYKNTQFAWVIWLFLAFIASFTILAIFLTGSNLAFVSFLVILALVAFIFYGLTIQVNQEQQTLSWWFGPSVAKMTLKFDDIDYVQPVTNSLRHGIGMRISTDGWVYTVAGFKALEVVMKDGTKYRLGTNDQSNLVTAMESKLKQEKSAE